MHRTLTALLLCLSVFALACQDDASQHRDKALDVAREALAREDISRYDRVVAAGILLNGGSVEGEEVLVEALTSGAELARQAAVGAVLTVRGNHAMDWFGRIADQSEDLRRSVLEGLRFTPRPDATEIIRAGIRSGNPKLQVSAYDAAALIGDVSLLPVIEDSIDTLEDPRMRAYAVYAASALGTERLSDWIESLIRSNGELQREIAAACLGLQPSEWGILELEKLSHDPSPRVRIAASASRVRLGIDDAETYLTKQILGADARMAQIAAGALKRSDPRYVVELASVVLEAPDVGDEAAGRVLEALGWARDIEAREVLERALSPERGELLRLQSLWAVGWRGRSDELALAESHLDDTSAPVRVMAAWAVLYGGDGGYSKGTGFLSEGRSL